MSKRVDVLIRLFFVFFFSLWWFQICSVRCRAPEDWPTSDTSACCCMRPSRSPASWARSRPLVAATWSPASAAASDWWLDFCYRKRARALGSAHAYRSTQSPFSQLKPTWLPWQHIWIKAGLFRFLSCQDLREKLHLIVMRLLFAFQQMHWFIFPTER